MKSEAKLLYDTLNEEGTLKEMYGKKMTGEWGKDKKAFMSQYEDNEKLFTLDTIDLDDVDESFDDDY